MKKVFCLFCVAFLFIFLGTFSVIAQQPTVEDNVMLVLRALGLEDSIVITERHKGYIMAKETIKSDGTSDSRLRNYILESRAQKKNSWFRDNPFLSWLEGHGSHSYRQCTRPSLQAVFYFKDGKVDRIKLDLDRFPPNGSAKISSARHFLQEQLPNFLFRKNTDSVKIHNALQKLYKPKTAGVVASQ